MLGVAGVFANGYITLDAIQRPGAAVEYARKQLEAMQNTQNLSIFNQGDAKKKQKEEATAQDQFAAIVGQAARLQSEQLEAERFAENWAVNIVPLHLLFAAVSLVSVFGAMASIGGRFYWLAILGSLIAVLNFNNACCIPGGIAGVWCFLQLIRDEGRMHFGLLPKVGAPRIQRA